MIANLFIALTPMYYWLDIGLLAASVALLLVSVLALVLRALDVSENYLDSESKKPVHYRERAPRTRADGLLEILDPQGQPSGVGHLINLSLGGISFLSQRMIPKGGGFRARFHLVPAALPITVSARVVWFKPLTQGFLYGVQYENPARSAPNT